MQRGTYQVGQARGRKPRGRKVLYLVLILVIIIGGGIAAWKLLSPSPVERAVSQLQFDASVSEAEKQLITQAVSEQQKTFNGDVTVSIESTTKPGDGPILSAYVPVTGFNNGQQSVTASALSEEIAALPGQVGTAPEADSKEVVLIPVEGLNDKVKLLQLDDNYYLDEFNLGAVFREVSFTGSDTASLNDLKLSSLPTKDSVLSVNQTGVTALTRQMMTKLRAVGGDATYFSEKIGDFLASADITHVSNEVSFQTGCRIGDMLFCSPPEMIEALKASGVDVVELTGNHNNDLGANLNTETIKLYHSLGWGTFGGGLNTAEAAKPWTTEQKNTKLALLGYNYPDSPNGGAIAGPSKAGANSFDFERIEADIKAAKDQGQYAIVDVQFWECYAYPDGYVEFPQCDGPIPNQAEVFRKIIDLGADMVMGSSAHQPQTYELYNSKPIYYGLGNLYFDQYRWPGTERGIVLTHYFLNGKLLQTKLTPTVYGSEMQPRVMDEADAVKLLNRLGEAR